MDIEYVDVMTVKNCRQFRLLTWTSLVGHFVHRIVILASYKFHYISEHENLVKHPSNKISIYLLRI